MSTAAQKSANAANSRRSTGPTTEDGKQKASKNSAKHYLTAKQLVVPGEDPEAYTELHQSLAESWSPANAQESLLVEQIAQNAWRLARVRRLEVATFEWMMPTLEASPVIPGACHMRTLANHDDAMARAFHENAKAFDNLRRYTTPIERAYHNAIAELTKLQKERKKSEIGSVSQTPESGKVFSTSSTPAAVQETPEGKPKAHADKIPQNSRT
jgi:hypothetical protein